MTIVLLALLAGCRPEDESGAPCTPTEELQDGVDNNCDGAIDEGSPTNTGYAGCGAATVGGAGGREVWVETLADAGPGSLREALALDEPRRVMFAVSGTIQLESPLSITAPFLTLDGASAPSPGVTLAAPPTGVALEVRSTHDVILSHLRVADDWAPGDEGVDGDGAIQVVGDAVPTWNVVIDHVTVSGANDVGLDVWGAVEDVTISWSLLHSSRHPTTVSHHPEPYFTRDCVTLHHDAWVRNGTRNPQLRGDSRRVDVAYNLVADWGHGAEHDPRGITVRAEDGEPAVAANIHHNLLLPDASLADGGAAAAALVYGQVPGPEDDGGPAEPVAQGTVVTGSRMGELWVAENVLPSEAIDVWSTVAAPLDVPEVPADPDLAATLPAGVGCRDRTSEEAALLEEIRARLP